MIQNLTDLEDALSIQIGLLNAKQNGAAADGVIKDQEKVDSR